MIGEKAKLVSDIYCDGLGDCIGECPRGAITFEIREAEPYDEEAVKEHLRKNQGKDIQTSGCPGSIATAIKREKDISRCANEEMQEPIVHSELLNWPVQLTLVPVNAPYLSNRGLLVASDCTAFAHGNFHGTFLKGEDRVCLIGCPKLDDRDHYRQKLAEIIKLNDTPSITLLFMEVPCCSGMIRTVEAAIEDAAHDMELKLVRIGTRGDILAEDTIRYRYRKEKIS